MAASTASIIFFCISAISTLRLASSLSVCPPQSHLFLSNLQSQCPAVISPFSHIEVDGESLDKALSSSQKNLNTAVLFYASWCPFSRGVLPTFDALSSMFPQIRHLAVEQSSALPSLFSRYGIHSLPAIFLVNQTERVHYCGPKDLSSLIQFYTRITGIKPVGYFTVDQPSRLGGDETLLQLWNGSSAKEILMREPYLLLAVLFLCLRAFLHFFPAMLSRFRAFWISYIPHLNLGIFGETSQLLGRALHLIDVKRVFSKLRLSKTRNFQKGAKNARVWASSLTSVSLGESSSARPTPSGDL
ncbi:5'-adenylylsulfate reductase-like 7 [Telopea speciosissima]|uniref:5'-adenylylsulfate reductase-like 7 n=1 Tax=Telopea speciosissima TaxID=54955 RepID=UPI001CC42CEB|nr:5'-adenylylsulfate reductase-like 7 [Telopea speciosissima]